MYPYKLYKRRWYGLMTIVLLNLFCTGTIRLTFTAAPSASENWFNTNLTLVNLTVILQYLTYIITTPFTGYIFEKWGLKRGLIAGALITLIGCWIRYFGSFIQSSESKVMPRYLVVMLGHTITASGAPFFNNSPSKFAATWFDDKSRGTAITIGALGAPLSSAVALVMIPAITNTGSDMERTLLIVSGIATISALPVFLASSNPPTPPSASAQQFSSSKDSSSPRSFITSVRTTLKNRQFLILFLNFALFVGFFNAFVSFITQFTVPYGYSEADAGIFSVYLIGAGIIGAGLSGPLMDRTKQHKLLIKSTLPIIALLYIGLVFTIKADAYWLISINCALLGFFSFALLPISFELSIESTYPTPPATSSSILWIGGQFSSVIMLAIVNLLRDESPQADPPGNMRNALIFIAATSTLTALTVFFYNSPNLRMKAEREAEIEENFQKIIQNKL